MASVGNKYSDAKRVSERGAFVISELFKLRRMTREQLERLLGDVSPVGRKFFVLRLQRLGLVEEEDAVVAVSTGKGVVRAGKEMLVKLTELGRRRAADALGREHSLSYRDTVAFYSHLLLGVDLYLAIVTTDARSWLDVRERASAFEWFASDDGTQFEWHAPAELVGARQPGRKLVPDITIETDTRRFLVEIERSTKTLRAVERKIENYVHLFSPLKSAADRPAYSQKYGDDKRAAVVFVFQSEERAKNARKFFERRAGQQNFRVPEWRCGTVDTIADYLRAELLGAMPSSTTISAQALSADTLKLVHSYVTESMAALIEVQNAIKDGKTVQPPRIPQSSLAIRDFLKAHAHLLRGRSAG